MEISEIGMLQDEGYLEWINRTAKFVNKENEEVSFDVLKEKRFIGIYFAANWFPMSKNYLHIFDGSVKAMEQRDDNTMGMILVSCDQNEKDMLEFVTTASIDYPIIPHDSQLIPALKEKFEVEEIPILVVLNMETNAIVDKMDKLKLESLLENENPEALCDTWLGLTSKGDENDDVKVGKRELKQNQKAEKERLKKEAAENKKQEKAEKNEQKKIAKLEKKKSKDGKKFRKSLLSTSSQANIDPKGDSGDSDKISEDVSSNIIDPDFVLSEQVNDSSPKAHNVMREDTGNLSDSSYGSIDIVSGKRKKKRSLWSKSDSSKQKEAEVQISSLFKRNNELEHMLADMKKSREEQDAEVKELHAQVDDLNGKISDKDLAYKTLEDANKQLNQQLTASNQENQSLKEEGNKLKEDLNSVKEELGVTKQDLQTTQVQLEEIEQEKKVRDTEHQKFVEMVELNGWMHKRGRKNFTRGIWRNRYFQAGEGFKLYYYKSPKMKTPRGYLNLTDVVKVEPVGDSKNTLLTISTDNQNLELRAPDETTRDNWINSINFLVHFSKKYQGVNGNTVEENLEVAVAGDSGEAPKAEPVEDVEAAKSIEISPVTAN